MLGGGVLGGVSALCLRFTNNKNCFLHLPPHLVSHLSLHQGQAVEVSWGKEPVYFSWVEIRHYGYQGDNVAELNRQMAEKLGIKDGEQVFIKPCFQVLSCKQVTVEPLSIDDWEILELHALSLERLLLDQIRIVYPSGIFPVWIEQHTCIFIKIGELQPAAPYGRLEALTELLVTPKTRQPDLRQSFHQSDALRERLSKNNTDSEKAQMAQSTNEPYPHLGTDGQNITNQRDGTDVNTLPSIWGLIGSIFSGRSERTLQSPLSKNEMTPFEMTSLSLIHLDAVFRVCKCRFPIRQSISSLPTEYDLFNSVHVFPWHIEPAHLQPPVTVTFGKMTKLLSPRQQQEKSKQDLAEKKKQNASLQGNNHSDQNGRQKASHTSTVKIVWHGFEDLKDEINYNARNGAMHVGHAWIPDDLRTRLDIELHAAVRITSSDVIPKIPTALVLQPKDALDADISEQDVKSAFSSWLLSYVSVSLPWIMGYMDHIHLSIKEKTTEFVLSVVNPTNNKDAEESMFMLSSTFLQQTNIQVMMQPVNPEGEVPKSLVSDQNLPYYKLNCLGGVFKLGTSSFEHIASSLLGSPLHRQLATTAAGLRSGALLITGAKGSGKSTLSKALCKEAFDNLEAHVEEMDCKSLKGKRFENMRQKLEEVFAEATWRQPSVLLLDDLDHVVGVPSSPELEQSPEAFQSKQFAQVLKDLVKEGTSMGSLVVVIATSQSEHSLHPSLVSAQGTHLFQCFKCIHPPDQEQRFDILRSVIQNKLNTNINRFPELDLHFLARETEGFVARDFTMLVDRALHACACNRRICTREDLILSTMDFQKALKGFTPSALRNVNLHKPKDLGWDRVGGLHEIQQTLVDTIQLPAKYPELFANLPIRHRSGVLLYGAPGTGKTLLAGVAARESGMNFINIKGPELLSKYIGASEQAIRDVFTRAQAAKPCILFFDEFDSIAPRRGHDNTGVTDRVVNQLLTQLDGVEGLQGVYVLAATSRPDLIDPALLRPGRLDKCLYCPPPDQSSRYEILKALSHSLPLSDDVDFQQLSAMTEYFTGADLKALLYNAQLEAMHTSLVSTGPQDTGSGSDSDISLSSMIFVNHSSGSDDSNGDGESGLDHSLMSLETSEPPLPGEPRSNMWRLYFGSSYESELGNGTPSDLNSQCFSGPNSITHDFSGLILRDLVSTQPPVFITSSQEDSQEYNQEQIEQLRAEISVIKSNYTHQNGGFSQNQPVPTKSNLAICQSHLLTALGNTRPSISQGDWTNFVKLYDNFQNPKRRGQSGASFRAGQKVTLA